MLACALWLRVCVGAFGDEVFGTALQERRQRCQRSKNLITLAGRAVVGFSLTQQNTKKGNKLGFFFHSLVYWNFCPHVKPHTVIDMWNTAGGGGRRSCAALSSTPSFPSQKSWSSDILTENKPDKTSHFRSLRMCCFFPFLPGMHAEQ